MSFSHLEKSQAQTQAPSESLDLEIPNEPENESRKARFLSVVYVAVMSLICAIILKPYTGKWGRWAVLFGLTLYLSTRKPRPNSQEK